jgi:outer membrane protein OmpA-like peptidoglycan-associated protein
MDHMKKHFLYVGLVGCALSVAANPSVAGPSKADLEKALSACPPGQAEGQNGLCQPSQGDQMGYDFVPQGDVTGGSAKHSGSMKAGDAHGKVASVAPMPTGGPGLVDLQMTFARSSSALTDADKATADTLTHVLLEPANATKIVGIGGHTSSSGTAAFNEELSKKRADAVKDYLVANGVPATRLKTIGYGATQPMQGSNPAAAENQRVVLTMLGMGKP